LGDTIIKRNSHASALNDWGEAVGRSQLATGNNYHGFITRSWLNPANNNQWEPLPLTADEDDMGTATALDAHTSEFNDINAYGEVVGRGHTPSGQMRALYKGPATGKNQGYYDLGVLGAGTADAGTESVAHAISFNGIIVGQSRLRVGGSQVWRAFVASNAGNAGTSTLVNLTDVTSLYLYNSQTQQWEWKTAASQGWTLTSAERVNKAGWIAGYGTKNGQTRAFVLSPR
jgi:hypothetical protein